MKIECIESAKFIDNEVDVIREKISQWSANLGNYKINGKSLKEWFLLPKDKVSTWWFSLISEKNSLKTDIFFHIAQIQAIDNLFSTGNYDLCVLSLYEKGVAQAIKMLCKRHSIKDLSCFEKNQSFREIAWSFLDTSKKFIQILKELIKGAFKIIVTRLIREPIKSRVKKVDNSILFVSYFPAVDEDAAIRGILKNKFSPFLQEKLSTIGKKIIWIWIYVFIDGHNYRDALLLTKKFTKYGETNFLLYEFISCKVLLQTLFLWFRQILFFLRLRHLLSDKILYEGLSIPESVFFIKKLMVQSFIGKVGLEGILYFELYKKIFSFFSYVSHCIYYSEMHAWEKALNAAKQLKAPEIKSIAFQHTSISKNFFHYFYHPTETTSDERKEITLPLPDILACNGDIPLKILSFSHYPKVKKVESIRYLYLRKYIQSANSFHKKNVILIVGSINIQETKALISLCNVAFFKSEGFQVWFKGHPSLPFEQIMKELNINLDDSKYEIKHEPMSKLIEVSRIVIVGVSTVALEALAAGCKVISPVLVDQMFMSPLKGFEDFYVRVYTPEQLREAVEEIMNSYIQNENQSRVLDFISQYWCLDETLKRWEEIFK